MITNYNTVEIENSKMFNKNTILILSSGLEERSLGTLYFLKNSKIIISKIIIFDYLEIECDENMMKMIELAKEVASDIFIQDNCIFSNPTQSLKSYFSENNNLYENDELITVDITSFSIPYYFSLLSFLVNKFKHNLINIIYATPESYADRQEDIDEIKLSEGLNKVAAIPGFQGLKKYSKDVLIVLLGYEGKRSLEVLNATEPDSVYALHGMPSYKIGTEEISILANKEFLREANINDGIFYSSAIDPFDTYNVLKEIVSIVKSKDSNANITISPLGSRLQSLGIFLYTYKNGDIQVAYPIPSSIEKGYSKGIGKIYAAKINVMSRSLHI